MGNSKESTEKVQLRHPLADFIPYSLHYDDKTVILKNNHLMQTIKITGFNNELVGKDRSDIKTSIRNAIKNNIKDERIALYLHTIRSKKNLRPKGVYKNEFCKVLDDNWNKLHEWDKKFVNELYLTFIYQAPNLGKEGILNNIIYSSLKNNFTKKITKNSKKLNLTVENVLKDLTNFGAKRLSIYKKDGIYYSQILRFLNKIINFEHKNFPLDDVDISENLIRAKMAFGTGSFEIHNNNQKYFGTLFTIKEYSDLSSNLIDKFLQLPIEFIITQTLTFVSPDEVLASYEDYNQLLKIAPEKYFNESCGIKEILDFDKDNSKTAFGKQQLLVSILANSKNELAQNIEKSLKVLFSFGLVCVKENLFTEGCFWSQLPGNFTYIIRKEPTNTYRYGGFGSLSNFPAGSIDNNKWDQAISILYTVNKTPYFFNFHNKDNGHTLVLGPYGSGKSVLLNFLIAQTTKIDVNIFYFDFFNSSEIFINALDGDYKTLMLRDFKLKLNPFLLEDTALNREFLIKYVSLLTIDKSELQEDGYKISEQKKSLLTQVIDQLYKLPTDKRNITSISQMLSKSNLANKINYWLGDGKFAKFFDHATDDFTIKKDQPNIISYDLTNISESKVILYPLIAYFLHKIETEVTTDIPTIIILDEAWKLIDNPIFAPELNEILERFKAKNIIVIFSSESIEDVTKSHLTSSLVKNMATQIFLANPNISKEYQAIFDLTDKEYNFLDQIKDQQRSFMLKHAGEAVIAELDLSLMEDMTAILSSNEYGIEIMHQVMEKTKGKSSEWIPVYLEILSDIVGKEHIDFAELKHELLEIDIDDYRNRAAEEYLEETNEDDDTSDISMYTQAQAIEEKDKTNIAPEPQFQPAEQQPLPQQPAAAPQQTAPAPQAAPQTAPQQPAAPQAAPQQPAAPQAVPQQPAAPQAAPQQPAAPQAAPQQPVAQQPAAAPQAAPQQPVAQQPAAAPQAAPQQPAVQAKTENADNNAN